ncbi:MAG: hypothetical protein P8L47_00175 [Candidatus Marinamargulisbacteria bacterium]|nr:hypothetical protein [Candidatus Marinamargulisbacteria bacterium]
MRNKLNAAYKAMRKATQKKYRQYKQYKFFRVALIGTFGGIAAVLASWLLISETACFSVKPGTTNTQLVGNLPAIINEASGMVASVQNPELLWVHNDSGDAARLFGIRPNGSIVVELNFPEINAVDWEDIALDRTTGFIYIGDIGDNFGIRKTKTIYRFKEPIIKAQTPRHQSIQSVDTLTFKYPDGRRDAETLFVYDGALIVISKRDQAPHVYQLPLNFDNDSVVAIALGTLAYRVNADVDRIVAGDSQGDHIALRSANRILLWHGRNALLNEQPKVVDYPIEPQGESLALDTHGLYTVSECCQSKHPPIYYTRL